MVSVIIPAYNAEKYIDKCLISVLQQTYKDMEIIVVNDGSTDSTESIVKKYCDEKQNIRLFSQKNQGVSAARNQGIANANGEFLFFIDADDYVDNDLLKELVNEADLYNSDLICGEIIDNNSSEIARKAFSSDEAFFCSTKEEVGQILFFVRMGSAVGKLYRKELIDKYNIKFEEGVNLAEDFLFVHEYCMHCNSMSKNIKAKYIVENVNADSLSKKYVSNLENILIRQNTILQLAFEAFPDYKREYYKHSIDIEVKACFFTIKNLFLKGCDFSWKDKISYLKSSKLINETWGKLPIKDISKLDRKSVV